MADSKKRAIRSTGSATITFGMVSVPVKLYAGSTESSTRISFNLLHGACGHRVKQQYVCENCVSVGADGQAQEPVVTREEMVKGFEVEKGKFVTFTADEIEALEAEASGMMEITEFVFADSVNPIYFDKPYYLTPDKGGAKAFALLAQAMIRTGREAIAKYAARGKQYVVLIRPAGDGLLMHQLRYAEEVRTIEDVPVEELPAVDDKHLGLAVRLVEQNASAGFRPDVYIDEVRERMLAAIQRKVEGGELAAPPSRPEGRVVDLMAALEASLDAKAA